MKLTKKNRVPITIELWEILKKTGGLKEDCIEFWAKYGEMAAGCPLCAYDLQHPSKDDFCNCPLDSEEGDCCSKRWAFCDWAHAETKSERMEHAGIFVEQLKALEEK